MILHYLLVFVISILNAITSWIPAIEHLPTIGGVDTDYYLSIAFGYFFSYIEAIWPIYDLYVGVVFYLVYLGGKMVLKAFLGHRAPD